MLKSVSYFFVFLLLLRPFPVAAQSVTASAIVFKEEKEKLIININYASFDSSISSRLTQFVETEVDGIYKSIMLDTALSVVEKEKAFRSLVYFIRELGGSFIQQRSAIYDIPGACDSYKKMLKALLNHKPVAELLTPLGWRRSQLMASTFSQYNEHTLLGEIAVFKRMASSPEFITRFLENKPGFRFADSLLLISVAHDPLKILSYLDQENNPLKERIRNIRNKYVQQIVSLSGNKNASVLLPFVIQLAENNITPDSILLSRMDVATYFQLLVNTLKESGGSTDPSFIFQKSLRNGLREKALSFYVNPINEMHSESNAIRFASVKDLRPEDIYYIITSCGEELYTSSYLGLYSRLMAHFKNMTADSLFSIVKDDNFRIFMRTAANYNTLGNFLSNMPREKASELLKRFIFGIESDTDTGLEKAMDIADSFTGLDSSAEVTGMVQAELQSNLNRCKSARQYFGVRLYSILLQVFDLVKQKDALSSLWGTLGNYDVLQRSALQNKNGEIIELVLFYGDEDGVASFKNFQKNFTKARKWEISKNEQWITIRSLSDEPIIIYANLPLDNKEELDLKAQDSLITFLDQQSAEPTVLVHRGHSYHLSSTLKRLKPSVKLAILGSCGSYNSAISIATINPDVQIIGSKKMGSKSINDPIIDEINETLQSKKDLSWSGIWEKLAARFRKDEFALNLFNEYIPPGKNVSLFVLKLFNFNNRSGQLRETANF